jgi:uncharacterized protein (DUF488 family)
MFRGVPATIWTVGYEKLLPPALVAELQAAGVRRVIDVRFRPQSRRPGMSKTRLGALLAEHGIAYVHRRELGTPADMRWLFHSGRIAEAAAAYRAHVDAETPEAIDELAAELDTEPPTALLCLEADPAGCHRRVITDALRERRPGLRVVDL